MVKKSEPRKKQFSPIGFLFGKTLGVLLFLFISLMISILIEWVGIFTVWKKEGLNHSVNMYISEIEYANANIKNNMLFNDARGMLAHSLNKVDSIWKGTEKITEGFYIPLIKNITKENGKINFDKASDLWKSAYYISKTFILRLVVIIFSLPLFFLALWYAFIDGSVERELRKYGGDKESNVVFDLTSKLSTWVVALGCMIYLAMPISINPIFCIVPTVIIFFSLTRTAITQYKKKL